MGPTAVQLRCPSCLLAGQPTATDDATLLRCGSCGHEFAVVDDIPRLFVDDWSWRTKQAESDGWEAMSAELGQIAASGGAPAVDFAIPFIDDEPWRSIGDAFRLMTDDIDVAGKSVLDIGAGRPWAAKNFALRGATALAIDVNAHEVVGLGRGHEMMQDAGVDITLLVGDGERLPIADEQLDIVFMSAAMHHTNFLRRLAREIARVLKPGGTVLIINEPTRAATDDEADLLLTDAEPELRHGITERRPSAVQYLTALSAAGLSIDRLELASDDSISAVRPTLTVPALRPVGPEWFHWSAAPRLLRALATRRRHLSHELEFRAALPRRSRGVGRRHHLVMAAIHGRNIINIAATKPFD